MKLHINNQEYIDTNEPLDISIPLINNDSNPKAWYVDAPKFTPVRTENYVGSVEEGGSVNFRDIAFNPHGHGTHTECLGHITKEVYSVNKVLNNYFFKAQVVSIEPLEKNGDRVIVARQLEGLTDDCEALVIRTMPNDDQKQSKNYSATNPAYLDVACVSKIVSLGIKHLLVDLPSVDKENDNGELAFHHAFWEVPSNPNFERTITELIYVPDSIDDGIYVLNIQTAPFENDATPSRPVLYKIKKS